MGLWMAYTFFRPGDPIEMDFNLNPDIEEHFLPDEYPDAPPDEDQPDES